MQTFWQDLRYGARMLLKKPGFTIIAVVTLALGIGANTAIFSIVNAVLLHPLPFKDPAALMMVWERRPNSGKANLPVSAHEFAAWREQSRSFEYLALVRPDGLNLTGHGEPAAISASEVSADIFSVLGVSLMLGRGFAVDEDQAGGAKVVVLSHKLWVERFNADPDVVGQTITLNDQSYSVVGVLPSLELMPDVLLPIDLSGEMQKVGKHSHQVIGRLNPGVTIEQALTELAGIAHQLEAQYPDNNIDHGVQIVSLHEETVGGVRLALLVLYGAVAFVLLIACANVANLLLARATARQQELAIRTALGAGRGRLIRQLLTESLLLAVLGGGFGLLLAVWLIDLLLQLMTDKMPRIEQVSVNGPVLIATVGLSLLTGLLTGIAPAWRSSKPNLSQMINEGTRASAGASRRSLVNLLVVGEVAMALILLIAGGLMLKSYVRLTRIDPGFDPHNVLRLDLALSAKRYSQASQQQAFYEQLIERLRSLPGVEAVGATTQTPLNPGDNWTFFAIEGRPPLSAGQEQNAAMRSVSNDYFSVMKIPLRQGRYFTDGDARLALPVMRWYEQQPYPQNYDKPQPSPVILINETMARMYWPNENPLGKRIRIVASPWLTVVGVVGDVRHSSLHAQPNPEMYLSHLQEPSSSFAVMVRTTGDPLQLAAAAREQVKALDTNQPVTVTTMEKIFSDSVAEERFNALLLGLFSTLALALAVVGVFGVINYSVIQRTHEIGVRLALGAQRRDILKLVISQGLVLTLTGIAIGLAGAFALRHVVAHLLFEVSPTDAATFLIISALLAGAALLACYTPSRRAMKVEPMIALRRD